MLRLPAPLQSVGGQLLVLLLAAVLVTQGLAVLLFSDQRLRAVRAVIGLDAAGRAANVALQLEHTPPSLQDSVLQSADSPMLRFALGDTPVASVDNPTADRLITQIRQTLSNDDKREIRAVLSPIAMNSDAMMNSMPDSMLPMHETMQQLHIEPVRLDLSIRLNDGRWLNVETMFHRPQVQWSTTTVFSILSMAGAVALIVLVVVRQIVKPMEALAQGAERIGRGMETAPLPLSGPREVRDTVEAFNRMQARLTRFLNDRTRLLAALGHDLRSPLTAMRIRLELLEENEDVRRLKALVEDMQHMVETTLAFARGALHSEPAVEVNLTDMLLELVEDFRLSEATVSLTAPDTVSTLVRPTSLRRALRNLIDNAIRYGNTVEIGLENNKEEIQIVIDDRGPGIPEEQMATIFEPFVRLEHSRSRDTGGIGLGLAIARTIVQAHGGEIALSNRPAGGLSVCVHLPKNTEPQAVPLPEEPV